VNTLSSESGLTFIEVMVVTVLLGFLSLIAFGSIDGIVRTREALSSQSKSLNVARTAFERIGRELTNRSLELIVPHDDSSSGQRTANANLLLGESDGDGKDSITFSSAEVAQSSSSSFSNQGIVQIKYFLAEDPDSDSDRDSKGLSLVRNEILSGSDADQKKSSRVVFPIASGIKSLDFRYWKDEQWFETWDESNLPDVVEVSIKLIEKDGSLSSFRTAFAIKSGR